MINLFAVNQLVIILNKLHNMVNIATRNDAHFHILYCCSLMLKFFFTSNYTPYPIMTKQKTDLVRLM